jgi:hypothetical protein
VWCGVVWCGVVWCGVVWCGVARSSTLKETGMNRSRYYLIFLLSSAKLNDKQIKK